MGPLFGTDGVRGLANGDLLMWHGLGVARLDVGAPVPLTVAVTHLGPWNPAKQLADAVTVTGQLPTVGATILGAGWNSFRSATFGCLTWAGRAAEPP